jgi:hypothetical protein
MVERIRELQVEVVAFVEDYQPGIVKCELRDASGQIHTFIEKVPYVISEPLDSESEYPCPGAIRCELIERFHGSDGRELVRVTTERPWFVESVDGISEFVVLPTQLAE